MNIRPIQPKDDPALRQLIRVSLKDAALNQPGTAYFDPELAHLSAYYAKPHRAYFVLTDEQDQVLGGAGIGDYAWPDRIAELQKVYIAKNARGQGCSHALLRAAETFARGAGYHQIYLETYHTLTVALALYQQGGYQRIAGPLRQTQHSLMDRFFVKALN